MGRSTGTVGWVRPRSARRGTRLGQAQGWAAGSLGARRGSGWVVQCLLVPFPFLENRHGVLREGVLPPLGQLASLLSLPPTPPALSPLAHGSRQPGQEESVTTGCLPVGWCSLCQLFRLLRQNKTKAKFSPESRERGAGGGGEDAVPAENTPLRGAPVGCCVAGPRWPCPGPLPWWPEDTGLPGECVDPSLGAGVPVPGLQHTACEMPASTGSPESPKLSPACLSTRSPS